MVVKVEISRWRRKYVKQDRQTEKTGREDDFTRSSVSGK